MKKGLLFLSFMCSTFLISSAQTKFSMQLYAGTNASWGEGQYLSIDAKGNAKYDLSEVNKGVKDSLSFVVSPAQLNQLDEVVSRIQFFKLGASYNSQSRDGTRLSVEISNSGQTHTVNWINIHTNETALLVDKLNQILKDKGIIIHY